MKKSSGTSRVVIKKSKKHGGDLWRYRQRPDGKMIPLAPKGKTAGFSMKPAGKPKTVLPFKPVDPVDPLDQAADAQAQLRYGGAQAELERNARAIPDWFKDYQDQINATTAANAKAQEQAQTGLAGLQAALTGLGTQQAQALQAGEAASAATRGGNAPTGQIGQTATNAGGVRRDMLGSFQALVQQQGLSQSARDTEQGRYAGGQLVSALAANAAKRQDLANERGAFKVDTRRKLLKELHDQAIEEAVFGRELAESASKADAAANKVNQWGYTAAQWQQMTPAERLQAQRAQKKAVTLPKAKPPEKFIHGYPESEWRKMTTAQRRAIIAKDKASGKKPKTKSQWANAGAQGKAADQIGAALSYARKIAKVTGGDQTQTRRYLLEGQKAMVVYDENGKPKLNKDGTKVTTPMVPKFDRVWVNVAMDLAFNGFISKANIKLLHARGIKVNALGYPTTGKAKPKPKSYADIVSGLGGLIK